MSIVLIGSIKGGVGKTTLATALASAWGVAGREVLLIDADEQGTATEYTQQRAERLPAGPGYTAVRLTGAAVRTQGRALAPKYQTVVIDAGGRDTGSLRAALTIADRVLIPLAPSSFDLWSLDQVAALLTEARAVRDVRAEAILTLCAPAGRDADQAAEAVRELGLDLAPVRIVRRAAWPNAGGQGLTPSESRPRDAKAVAELDGLVRYLSDI